MKRKVLFRILRALPLVILFVFICFYIYFDHLQGTTYTKVTVVKDKSESCMFGYRWATVVNGNGDSSDVLVDENLLFNNKLPLKEIIKQSQRFLETSGVIQTYIWDKSFWKTSFDVTVVKEIWSPYLNEVHVIAIAKNGIKIKCSIDKTLFEKKKIPFSAKVKNKVEGCIVYGFVIEE